MQTPARTPELVNSEPVGSPLGPLGVAPHLIQPGLLIPSPTGTRVDFAPEVLRSGEITRERLRQAGFIVFQNHDGRVHPSEGDIQGHFSQLPHIDMDFDIMAKHGVVVLQHSDETPLRRAKTAVANKREFCIKMMELLEKDHQLPEPIPTDYKQLKNLIAKYGKDHMLEKIDEGPMPWGEELFYSSYSFINERGSGAHLPLIKTLNDALQDITYLHEWNYGDALIIDNASMVHWRVGVPEEEEIQDAKMMQGWMMWNHDSTQPIPYTAANLRYSPEERMSKRLQIEKDHRESFWKNG